MTVHVRCTKASCQAPEHLQAPCQVFVLEARLRPEAEVEGVHHQQVLREEGAGPRQMGVCSSHAVQLHFLELRALHSAWD